MYIHSILFNSILLSTFYTPGTDEKAVKKKKKAPALEEFAFYWLRQTINKSDEYNARIYEEQ